MFSLIIPVYNEEGLIDELVSRATTVMESITVVARDTKIGRAHV